MTAVGKRVLQICRWSSTQQTTCLDQTEHGFSHLSNWLKHFKSDQEGENSPTLKFTREKKKKSLKDFTSNDTWMVFGKSFSFKTILRLTMGAVHQSCTDFKAQNHLQLPAITKTYCFTLPAARLSCLCKLHPSTSCLLILGKGKKKKKQLVN